MNKLNPHDQFFKELFSRKDHVAEDLKQHFSDLVYSCEYKNKSIRISLLFEHKSNPEPYLSIQLNRYLICAWNAQIKQKNPPSPIIPIVFYHGSQHWQPEGISSCFIWTDPTLDRYTPDFEFIFIDLSRYTWDTISLKSGEPILMILMI